MKEKIFNIVITGASNGLGNFLAQKLSLEGHNVLGIGRRERSLADLPDSIKYLQFDLSQIDNISHLAKEIKLTFDKIDIFIHCAAIAKHYNPSEIQFETLNYAMKVNSFSPYLLSKELIKSNDQDSFLSFIMMNTEASYHTGKDVAPYSASKSSLLVLSRCLADEVKGKNIGFSTIVLGPVANKARMDKISEVAKIKGLSEEEVTKILLNNSNDSIVIDEFIHQENILKTVKCAHSIGKNSNGMIFRLDGGAVPGIF